MDVFVPVWVNQATEEPGIDVLGAYLDRGGNFLDTANAYTKGHSEKIIGDYFKDHPWFPLPPRDCECSL